MWVICERRWVWYYCCTHSLPQSIISGPVRAMLHNHMSRALCTGLLMLALLAGCGRVDSKQNAGAGIAAAPETPITTPVTTPADTPTRLPPVAATNQALETRWAQNRDRIRTEVALTPTGPPRGPATALPTPTWAMGWISCGNGNNREPEFYSCWRGVINGEMISIGVGQQSMNNDRSQGLLMIFHGGWLISSISPTEIYSTPIKLGGMRIASLDLNSMLITLTPYDPRTPGPTATPGVTFVFDLATRQWVSPPTTPGPSPSALVSPVPSVSPLRTQSP